MGTMPRIKVYKVAAVFEIGMVGIRFRLRVHALKEAQAYFNRAGDVTAISRGLYRASRPRRPLRKAEVADGRATAEIFMIDWPQRNATSSPRCRSSAT